VSLAAFGQDVALLAPVLVIRRVSCRTLRQSLRIRMASLVLGVDLDAWSRAWRASSGFRGSIGSCPGCTSLVVPGVELERLVEALERFLDLAEP